MFLSTSHNKIDKKGRISVPRNFRTYLDLEGGSLILFKSLQFNNFSFDWKTDTKVEKGI